MIQYTGNNANPPNLNEYHQAFQLFQKKVESSASFRLQVTLFYHLANYLRSVFEQLYMHDKDWVVTNITLFLDEIAQIKTIANPINEKIEQLSICQDKLNYQTATRVLETMERHLQSLQHIEPPKHSASPPPPPESTVERQGTFKRLMSCCTLL